MKSVNTIDPKPSRVGSIDKSNLRQVILDFPKQFRGGIAAVEKLRVGKLQLRTPVVLCGMGGSGSIGDLLKLWLRHDYMGLSEFEVIIHRDYGLPKLEWKNIPHGPWEPLVVVISYSGNTEEALSSYEDAKQKRLPLVTIAAGGELKKRALRDKTLFVQIPNVRIPPRASFGYQFGSLAALLAQFGVLKTGLVKIAKLENLLQPQASEAAGKTIAKEVGSAIPLLYAASGWKELAQIIKIKFNEHAKWPAFANEFPELNHNEMIGFDNEARKARGQEGRKFHALILEDVGDHLRTKKRMRLTAKLLKERGVTSTFIPIEGKTVLEKVFSTLILGDWMAYWHAVNRGVDPSPVEMVEKFKKLLK